MTLANFDQEEGKFIVGVDEAGRGPLAGSVVAAAAHLRDYHEDLDAINDSKKLTEKKREALFAIIPKHFDVGIGIATVEEIEKYNILQATFLAMRRAVANLEESISLEGAKVLVDGNFQIPKLEREQKAVVKGDAKSLAIAAASIMAKVTRDHQLIALDKDYPSYGFAKHKGYGTKQHREEILKSGVIDGVHRRSFLTKMLAKAAEEKE